MKKLANMIDKVTQIGTSKCKVLKKANKMTILSGIRKWVTSCVTYSATSGGWCMERFAASHNSAFQEIKCMYLFWVILRLEEIQVASIPKK